ncbi:MAG: BON domain-containing protein [Gemmatimonadota bacterium]|nr:BON domain-containing protein [Gemmatimonadota bacterium]MDH3424498.1 BON domain-containing protein [Gemmatimonadota bacterium]
MPQQSYPSHLEFLRSAKVLLALGVTMVVALGAMAQLVGARTTRALQGIEAALDTTGNSWVMVEATGRTVHLRGAPPSAHAADDVLEIAHGAMCASWRGERRCARRVSSDFGASHLAWPDLQASVDRNVLTLSGEVPDAATHWAVVDRARNAVQLGYIGRVVDEMTLMDRGAPPGVDATAGHVAAVASLCEAGEVRLLLGVLSIRCEVRGELEADLRALIDAPLHAGYLGEVEVVTSESM